MVDGDWKRDILYGAGLGGGFVLLNLLAPEFRIGVPQAALGLAVVLAPLVEEFVFRCFLLGWAGQHVHNFGVANVIQAVAFSLFHWQAYGLALQAAFVGAFVFGLVAGFVAKDRRSIVPVIVMHAIFNFWIVQRGLVMIGGGVG